MDEMTHFPKLRFPEFSGDWEEKKFIDISEKIKDGTHFSPNTFDESDFLYITAKNVKNGHIDLTNISYVTKEEHKEIYKRCDVKFGDLLLTKDGTIGQACVNSLSEEFSLLSSVAFIRLNSFNSNNFLYQLIVSPIGQKEINKSIAGQALKRITLTKIKNFKSFFPFLLEQKKISNFLTSLDTKIEILSKKQELLSEYKKGLMQKIFSQELRFKADDGSDYPDWEEKSLGDIGEFKTSSVDKKIIEGQKLIRLVNYMNVYKHENIDSSATEKLMTVSANETQLNSSNLKRGDILFTPSSETPDDIGHSVVIFEDLVDTLYSYHLIRFRPKAKLDILYSHYFCNISDVLRQISRVATGSTRFTVSLSEFSKIQVNLPSLPEQTKIANFLSPIDSKIEQIAKQLYETKQFKKALLQQMFV